MNRTGTAGVLIPYLVNPTQAAAGLRVPQDLSIVGSNPTVPLLHGLALTVWDYPADEVGQRADGVTPSP